MSKTDEARPVDAGLEALRRKIAAKLREKADERAARRAPDYTEPRYDEVFFKGVEWLDSLSTGDDVEGQMGRRHPENVPAFSFVTDRLAVGDATSRATPGWCAVVSVLGNRGRPGDEWLGAPPVPGGVEITGADVFEKLRILKEHPDRIPVLCQDLADGEPGTDRLMLAATCGFVARRGRVLVHCGAGLSRSPAVCAAYLRRYAGMSAGQALGLLARRRPGADPWDGYLKEIDAWIGSLDEEPRP